tara:strand:+ start:1806 stop:2201 length:396 start_codon:yes stop_codon:yes gene_type:complete
MPLPITREKQKGVTMKSITLKLTDNEMMFLDISTDISKLNKGFEEEYVYLCKDSAKRMDIDISDNEYIIQDVDKFEEFLNNEIDKCFPTTKKMGLEFSEMLSYPSGAFYEGSESQKLDNLKSILSKLEEVK